MHTAERGRPLPEMIYGNDSIKFEGNSDDSSREARKIREATDTKDGKRATKNLPLCRTSFSVNWELPDPNRTWTEIQQKSQSRPEPNLTLTQKGQLASTLTWSETRKPQTLCYIFM